MMNSDEQTPATPYRPACTGNEPKLKPLFWLLLVFAPLALVQSGAISLLLFALVVAGLWYLPDRRGLLMLDTDRIALWGLLALLGYGLLSISNGIKHPHPVQRVGFCKISLLQQNFTAGNYHRRRRNTHIIQQSTLAPGCNKTICSIV